MGMFDKSKTVEAPAAPTKSTAKKEEVPVPGVEQLAMIDALQKTLETLRGTIEGEVKAVATTRFMDHIAATGQRPESFKALDGIATATLTLSRKSSSTALTEAAVALMRENGLEPEKTVVTPELFAINPAYASDTKLLEKVEKALQKIVPDDFILVQPEKAKLVATEATLLKAMEKRAPAEVIQMLTSVSCAPKLLNTDIARILEFVRGLMAAPAFNGAAANDEQADLTASLQESVKVVKAKKVARAAK